VRRAPSHSLLGPALLLYLVAGAAAAQGQLDLPGAIIAALAGLLSLSPLRMARSELPGSQRVGWLGLATAVVLVRPVAPHALSLTVDLAQVVALASCAALVLDLALVVPDRLFGASHTRRLRVSCYGLGAGVASLGAAAHAPALRALGRLWLAPAWLGRLPALLLVLALACALLVRLLRRRLSSSEEALASNAWAILGLAPAVGVACGLVAVALFRVDLGTEAPRAAVAIAAGAMLWSHMRLVDPSRRLSVGPTTRNAVAAVLALSLCSAASVIARPFWPEGPLAWAAGAVGLLLAAAGLYHGLRELARVALAPASGSLLLALERAQSELTDATDLQSVAKIALGAARAASGSGAAEPLLYLFDPVLELRIDGAGQPHSQPQPLHSVLLASLREQRAEILLRAPLEAQIVRKPGLRPLIEALCGLDALCLLPLWQGGDLEGALLLPRGARRSRLTLEEIEALHRFGRQLAGFFSVLCKEARSWRRAADALAESKRASLELTSAHDELARLSAEVSALRAGGSLFGPSTPSVAYSAVMRTLLDRADDLAASATPVLLVAERGIPLAPIAHLLHHAGGRGPRPLVVAQCAATRSDQSLHALVGDAARESPGWLGLAGDGTLLLCDLPALSLEAQHALAAVMAERPVRIVASCRRDPDELVEGGAMLPELRERFRACLRVPPLRERTDDLPSLCLIALDHSARVLGRPACGIDPDAQARLLGHAWPGNLEELHALIERAVARCEGPRITLADLSALGLGPSVSKDGHPLDDTLERVERRVLKRALERSSGNRSEAARLLGLKRTTFLDKLRRHGLEHAQRARAPGAEPN
jgi:DNA-binding NtrC family response regulator